MLFYPDLVLKRFLHILQITFPQIGDLISFYLNPEPHTVHNYKGKAYVYVGIRPPVIQVLVNQ